MENDKLGSEATTTFDSTDLLLQLKSLQSVPQKKSFISLRNWLSFDLSWLPLLFAFFLSLSIIIPYCIAVALGHVKPIFPSISDDGTTPPESCIFSQFLNLAAFFGFATALTRYKQVKGYNPEVPWNVLKWNKGGFFFGSLAVLGMSIVANFQITNIYIVHIFGASMCFIMGTIFEFIQTWISFKLTPQHSSLPMSRLRLSLSIITLLFMISFALFDVLGEYGGFPQDLRSIFKDVSAMSEWATAFSGMFFFLTFVHEFQTIGVEQCQRSLHLKYDSLV
ncbi:DNA damage-regulated autophagy modulator protein 1-like [Asterias amurensis]|uniref:DNA damage-regulated autophagy modulator protein 1-like n=1 Tax=Asterias amurensis TaxID=7602 RepID=UPI003AB310E9